MVTITGLKNATTEFVRENPLITGVGIATGVAGGALATAAVVRTVRKRRKTRKSKTTRRKRSTRRTKRKTRKKTSRKKRYKYARTAGKGRDRSTRRIRQTKHGQPYIILRSGKARFIKRSSARRSRRLKGGRY